MKWRTWELWAALMMEKQSPAAKHKDFGWWWTNGEMRRLSVWLRRIGFKQSVIWFMTVKHTLISYCFSELVLLRSHLLYPVDSDSTALITCMSRQTLFTRKNLLQAPFYPPLLFAISQQSMADCLPNASPASCSKSDSLQEYVQTFHNCSFISAASTTLSDFK